MTNFKLKVCYYVVTNVGNTQFFFKTTYADIFIPCLQIFVLIVK